jgi:hypothetical protein
MNQKYLEKVCSNRLLNLTSKILSKKSKVFTKIEHRKVLMKGRKILK